MLPYLSHSYHQDHQFHIDYSGNHNIQLRNCTFIRNSENEVRAKYRNKTIKPMILYLTFWSDDFQVNLHRGNEKSVWIKTVSVNAINFESTSTKFTYILCLGRKQTSHESINNIIYKEITKLQKCQLRYYGRLKMQYPVIVKPYLISADRPERSSLTCILSHTGLNTKR